LLDSEYFSNSSSVLNERDRNVKSWMKGKETKSEGMSAPNGSHSAKTSTTREITNEMIFAFRLMNLADAFIQSDLQYSRGT